MLSFLPDPIKSNGEYTLLNKILPMILGALLFISITTSAYSTPTKVPLEKQIKTLKHDINRLREHQHAMTQEHRRLLHALHVSETLLLKHDFQPRVIRTMREITNSPQSPKARSPLPKKRTRVRYLDHPQGRVQNRNLSALLNRSPVLIALWATWCKPCVSPQEQTHLNTLKHRLHKYSIPLISIGVDQWAKIKRSKERWFYPLWHVQDAHLNLTPEYMMREVGLGLPLFFLRLPDGSVPYFLPETLSDQSVDEWVTLAIRTKLSYAFE